MDKILQVSETVGLNYPDYFRVFLENCVKEFPDNFSSYDYLFSMIYFIILDSGFAPIDLCDEHPELCKEDFNINKLHQIKCFKKDYVKTWKGFQDTYMRYKIPIRFGSYKFVCEIHAVPSIQDPNYLIVNMMKRDNVTIRSLRIRLEYFLKDNSANTTDPKYKFTFSNIKELDAFIKSEMVCPTRETIMIEEVQDSCSSLFRLPKPVHSNLLHELSSNSSAVLSLSSTCSHFNNLIKSDSSLWLELCLKYYGPRAVSQLTSELYQYGTNDSTIYKQIFLELNRRKEKNLSGSYASW